MKKILFLTKFTALNAYTRYRVCQYLPYLPQAGFDYVVDSLFPDTYIKQTYSSQSRRRALVSLMPLVSARLARRWWLLVREVARYDIVFLQYEALPYAPFVCERALFRKARVVVDFDDAINVNYEQHRNRLLRRMLRAKIPNIVAHSSHVITANRHLAEWATQYNPNVTTIPNAVDLQKNSLHTVWPGTRDKPVIGWIGTPITAKYLRLLEKPLQALRARHDFVLKVIGVPGFSMDGVDVLAVPWHESSEAADLRACDIGIMPLPDDTWARGKSALKLIQYLAAEIAAVASPVGANCDVLSDGENGFFAATDEDWLEKLTLLIEEPVLRERLAKAGRRTVEERFSLQTNVPRFVDVLWRTAAV